MKLIYGIDAKPKFGQLIVFAIQQLLAIMAATLVVPINVSAAVADLGLENPNMSPFSSESFGGYSYSKAQGYAGEGGGMLNTWQAIFASRLAPWRKI